MTLVAGVDIGNYSTEVILGEVSDGQVRPRAWSVIRTEGLKGSATSLARAASELRHVEHRSARTADFIGLSCGRRVHTSALLQLGSRQSGCLTRLDQSSTPGGKGFATGDPVRLEAAGQRPVPGSMVIVVGSEWGHRQAAAAIREAVSRGVAVAGILVERDDASVLARMLSLDVPIVDEVDVAALDDGLPVALEVVPAGEALRYLDDPLVLRRALSLPSSLLRDLARSCSDLAHLSAAAVQCNTGRVSDTSDGVTIEYDQNGHRVSGRVFDLAARGVLDSAVPGSFTEITYPGMGPVTVWDAAVVDLQRVCQESAPRFEAAVSRPYVLSYLEERTEAVGFDIRSQMEVCAGRPVVVTPSEIDACAAGARGTTAAYPHSGVCDIGAGSIDVVTADDACSAAGGGSLVTATLAALSGRAAAAAELIKRHRSFRIESSYVAADEDGSRRFLDAPAPDENLGRLCTCHSRQMMTVLDRGRPQLSPQEWGRVRKTTKAHAIGGALERCLRALGEPLDVLALAGGGALDQELRGIIADSLRRRSVVVGTVNVAERLGPRYAAAWGAAILAAESRNSSKSQLL